MRLAQRVAIITGAGSGIGQAMAELFAREGARVLAADVNGPAAAAAAAAIAAAGGACEAHELDVTEPTQVRSMVERALELHGRIDILCNNAGTGSTTDVVDCEPAEWDRVMAVNVRGVYLGCKYVLPHMVRQRSGAIVNTASVTGMVGTFKRAAYSTSKGAVIALTRQVATDFVEHGIRVNCICPGPVDSPWVRGRLEQADDPVAARAALSARNPMGRLGRPEEIAAAALYLASDDAAFMTGTALVIDGGYTAR
jgi:NAD(P)-dependent dehydrogenase (short-subunit alcohol dehydrogenase family)